MTGGAYQAVSLGMWPFKEQTRAKANFSTYTLDERRTSNYTFTSMKGLSHYFSSWLEEEEVHQVIENAKVGFTIRDGISNEETKLQMIKKCEYALVRIMRKGNRT